MNLTEEQPDGVHQAEGTPSLEVLRREREVGSVPQGRWEAKLGTGALRRSLDVPSLKRGRWRSTPGGTHWLVFVKDRLEVVPMQFSPLLCAGKVL